MKKLFLTMLGVCAMLCSTSCSDEEIVVSGEGEAMVQFAIELDGAGASRADISDGETVNTVYYEVWGTKNNVYQIISDLKDTAVIADKQATINLALVKGQTYDIVFWASKAGVYNTDDLTNITVNEGKANDETKDAFTFKKTYTVNGPIKETIKLTRPFAQINFGTPLADMQAAEAAGADLTESKIKVTNLAHSYNALTEEGIVADGAEPQTVEFAYYAIPDTATQELTLKNSAATYEYLATAYVLFPGKADAQVTTDLTMTVKTELNQEVVLSVPNAPAQRNYRTNILGNLLTNQTDFTIEIDANFETPDLPLYPVTDYCLSATYRISEEQLYCHYLGSSFRNQANRLVSIDYGDGEMGTILNHTYKKEGYYNVKFYFEQPLTEIPSNAFENNSITSITIPNTVTKIGSWAFWQSGHSLQALEEVIFEEGSTLEIIDEGAFAMTSLKQIYIPKSVTTIAPFAFTGCSNLKSFIDGGSKDFTLNGECLVKILPNNKYAIIAYPAGFGRTDIYVYHPFEEIYNGVYSYCPNIVTINIYEHEKLKVGQIGYNCPNLTTVNGFEYITNDTIYSGTFSGCPKLTSISISPNVKYIQNSFNDNDLFKEVIIQEEIKEIDNSFNNCPLLQTIYCHSIIPPTLSNNVFMGTPNDMIIYVPMESVNNYKTAWSTHHAKIQGYNFAEE